MVREGAGVVGAEVPVDGGLAAPLQHDGVEGAGHFAEPAGLLLRQLMWGAAGVALLWALSLPSLNFYARFAPIAYGLGLASLVAVLVLGEVRGGSRAWFALGPLTMPIVFGPAWRGNSRAQYAARSNPAMM